MIEKIITTLKAKKEIIFFIICFVIYTIPRSIEMLFPKIYKGINIIKAIVIICIFAYFAVFFIKKDRKKISKYSIGVMIYALYIFIVTIFNKVNIVTCVKVYLLNVSVILLCEIIFNSDYKFEFIKFFTSYFLMLLVLNMIVLFLNYINNGTMINKENIYLLGQDNRFILYIIPTLLGYYYLNVNNKSGKFGMIITYIIGVITLAVVWSVASLAILIIIGLGFVVLKIINKYNIKINSYIILILLIALSVMIVFLKIQNCFENFIVNVLHKSMTLSYRTIMWDDAKEMLIKNPVNLIFGFGYFDTKDSFVHMPIKVNHLHNIVMDPLFAGGIIGLIIYIGNLCILCNSINKISENNKKNNICLIFGTLLLLLTFDTFEMYQIYYFILFLILQAPKFCNNEEKINIQ
ncbi:MAG: O-antigen ligase family protein [Clostridium sp.]|nr:O-antigen ligase family protein [Clostridium sp.]